jgi:hypothetical protein
LDGQAKPVEKNQRLGAQRFLAKSLISIKVKKICKYSGFQQVE